MRWDAVIVSSTEVQNNFGKYLQLAAQEEVIITRNGTEIARLQPMKDHPTKEVIWDSSVKESAEQYHFKGRKASYEEFLELTRDMENRYEYIDGEIYLLASPKTAHQYAVTKLFGLFFNTFQDECMPFVAPYDISLKRPNQKDPNVVQPDLMVICDLDDHINEQDYYMGVPSLVVEVLSESTRSKDMVKKLDLYMESGVKEYWIVNPFNRDVTIYYFEKNEVSETNTFKYPETAKSFLFENVTVELEKIFK